MKKKYGPIESMAIVRKKDGKMIARLNGFLKIKVTGRSGYAPCIYPIKATEDMLIRVVTRDEQGRRVTFFMKKA
jgi:hypothetical protein